ncbi:hypothetical protein DYH09_10615, partial [bacterium CPR1]|nr:hypothetical protein [bacterium CPR1]
MQLQSLTLTRPVRAATPAPAPSAPADTAGPSLPRRAVEGLGGVVGASVGALTSAVPAFFAGGFNGVAEMGEKYRPDPQADVMPGEALAGMHATLTAVQLTAAGAITGGLMFGGTGLAVGLVGGLVGGLAVAALQHVGGASQVLGQAINTAGDRAVADNLPSSRKTKDYTRAFTEGSLVGLGQGIRAGGSTGYSQGKGVTSGLLEGIKDGVGTLIGKFDPDTPKPPTPSRGFLHHLIRLPKYALQGATGLVGGAVGMALSTLDGTVQGLVRGVDDREGGSLGLHRGLVLGQSVVAGGVAGGLTFGPMGDAGGLLAGPVSGVVI